MKIVLTNEIGNVIIVSGTSYLVTQKDVKYTEVALRMIGPTSETEWMMTKKEAEALSEVLASVIDT